MKPSRARAQIGRKIKYSYEIEIRMIMKYYTFNPDHQCREMTREKKKLLSG